MKKKFNSILKHSIAITIITFMVLLTGSFVFIIWQIRQHKDMEKALREERADMADRIWKANEENFQNAVRDNSAWDDLADFVEHRNVADLDSAWLEDNFGYMLDAYTASMVAIFDANGKNLYTKIADGYEDYNFFSLDFVIVSNKFKETGLACFYMYKDNKLIEYFGASITTSADNDHVLPSKGFLILCRHINDKVMETYRESIGALLSNITVKDVPADTEDETIMIAKTLYNYKNSQEVYMYSVFENTVEKFFDKTKPVFGFFAVLCVVAMINLIVFMRDMMTKPLSKISESLILSDPTIINDLTKKKNEFGQIAQMLQEFFMQQEEVKIQNETLMLQSEEIRSINEDLNQQKNRLAEVNSQITDSISYAGRIQLSAVTPEETVRRIFPDSMVIYQPRDIVSGDWYYAAIHREKKVIVEADCTGHGVPGSLLSMLGISALKDIINTMEINGENIIPEEVLNRMRATIKSTLIGQSGDSMSMSDGMDMSIGVFEPDNSMVRFAGANQSLYIMRGDEITKLKGNRMPIGEYVKEYDFKGEDFYLKKDDAIFFMSDGIKDQIAPSMERFKWMRLEAFFIENSQMNMIKLREKLIQTISDWKGDMEQVDDMTLIGIRV
ncbi:MAG: SpoIIE family protein phosphatase [Bacteroidales bacterium]|nr:SpoIIE family protein phosphatase [Bacteroidales bacterium]